jgi:hypothetical protein
MLCFCRGADACGDADARASVDGFGNGCDDVGCGWRMGTYLGMGHSFMILRVEWDEAMVF